MEPERAGTQSPFAIRNLGLERSDAPHLVWGHGWGQSGEAMVPLAQSLAGFASSAAIDFPGFGSSPMPPSVWGTAEYADAVAAWLREQPRRPRFWVGYSFGGRIGIQLASRHPELVDGLILVASAGLPRKRSFPGHVRLSIKRSTLKVARRLLPEGPALERLRSRFGSADYRSAGRLRPILNKVVSENLDEVAAKVECRTLLLYGERDTETPVEIGRRLHALIKNSQLIVLPGLDHNSIVGEGRHLTARHILKFLQGEAQ